MQVKPKTRVYGKQSRQQDNLDEAFASLNLDAAASKDPPISVGQSFLSSTNRETRSRTPLRAISSNSTNQHISECRDVKSVEAYPRLLPRLRRPRPNYRNELAVLTSLTHVKDEIYDFEQACRLWAENYKITKIAHGSYAAIFRLQLRSDKTKYIIAKLMPVRPKSGRGSRAADQTPIEDAATEVKALDTMSEVPGFVGFSEAWVLRGALPALFLQQYKTWAWSHPDDNFTDYSKEQLWCFIEMSDAGTDLEQVLQKDGQLDETCGELGGKKSLEVTHCWDIFWGIVEALGRGEEFSEFEHRDLHPGNVCIIQNSDAACSKNEPSLRVKYTNLEVTLIDYTLSRATLANGEVLANPMRDKAIFEQRIENPRTQQQRNDSQQYETYRRMRQLVIELSNSKDESQAWQDFIPQTNMLWLHYILNILLCSIDRHGEALVGEEGPKTRTKKVGQGVKRFQHGLTTAEHSITTGDAAIGQLLETLRSRLDPDQGDGCEWSSAKALLKSELYWEDEICVGHNAPCDDK